MLSTLPSLSASDGGWRAETDSRGLLDTPALARDYQRLYAVFQGTDTAQSCAIVNLSALWTRMDWFASSKGMVRWSRTKERSLWFCTFLQIVFLSHVAGPIVA